MKTDDIDEEEIPILFEWVTCKPDPGAYKPYSPELDPVNVYVELMIPKRHVRRVDGKSVVLTPKGWAIANQMLTAAIRHVQNGE